MSTISSSQGCLSPASYQPNPEDQEKKTVHSIQIPFCIPEVVLARFLEFAPSVLPVLNKVRLLTTNSSHRLSKLDQAINGYLKGTESKHINEIPKFESIKQLRSFLEVYGKSVSFLDLSIYKSSKDDKSLNDHDVSELLSLVPNVEELNLSGCRITGSSLEGKVFPRLKRLNLLKCSQMSDEGLKHLNAPLLEGLDLSHATTTGSFLESQAFSRLKKLHLLGCRQFATKNLEHLDISCLEELGLSHMSISGSFLKEKEFSQLKKLILHGCFQIKDEHLSHLNAPCLEEFDLFNRKITGSFLENKAFSQLKRLRLFECLKFAKENLEYLNISCLEELDLSATGIPSSFLEGKAFSQLRRLILVGCNLYDEDLKLLNAPLLEELNLSSMHITGAFLEGEAFSQLRRLYLMNCRELTDTDLRHLNASCLKELSLSSMHITGSFLENKEFPLLEKFTFAGYKFPTDEYKGSIYAALVHFNAPRLKEFNLSNVSNIDLFFVDKTFPRLKKLSLSRCNISTGCGPYHLIDNGIKSLYAPLLEELDLFAVPLFNSFFKEVGAASQLKRLFLRECAGTLNDKSNIDEELSHLNLSCLEELKIVDRYLTCSFLKDRTFPLLKKFSVKTEFIIDDALKHLNAPLLKTVVEDDV